MSFQLILPRYHQDSSFGIFSQLGIGRKVPVPVPVPLGWCLSSFDLRYSQTKGSHHLKEESILVAGTLVENVVFFTIYSPFDFSSISGSRSTLSFLSKIL